MPIRLITQEEFDLEMSECSGLKWLLEEAHAIEMWSDCQFSTEDGRRFGLFLDGDSILKRLDARSIMINWKDEEGIQRVRDLAGFILEIDGDDPPLIFANWSGLAVAWSEVHAQFGVAPTEEEYAEGVVTELPDPNDEEDDNH